MYLSCILSYFLTDLRGYMREIISLFDDPGAEVDKEGHDSLHVHSLGPGSRSDGGAWIRLRELVSYRPDYVNNPDHRASSTELSLPDGLLDG